MKAQIIGGKKLRGTVQVGGYKHSVLPILSSCLLTDAQINLNNVPETSDVDSICDILSALGAKIRRNGSRLWIDTTKVSKTEVPSALSGKIHASYQIMAALLGRFGKCRIGNLGGCRIGDRSIMGPIMVLRNLGAKLKFDGYNYVGSVHRIIPAMVSFDKVPYMNLPAATKTSLILGSQCLDPCVFTHCYIGPEIVDLAEFLRKLGYSVVGAGTTTIKISRPKRFPVAKKIFHEIMSDRLEAYTYIVAALATGGEVEILGTNPEHLQTELEVLSCMSANLDIQSSSVVVRSSSEEFSLKNSKHIVTGPYPNYDTDLHPILTTLMVLSNGSFILTERVWPKRFTYVAELNKLGANIDIDRNSIHGEGVQKLMSGRSVLATDVRGGASVLIAALSIAGKTEINNFEHIFRGYAKIDEKLKKLGATIFVNHD